MGYKSMETLWSELYLSELTEFYTEKGRFYSMYIMPEFVLRVRNHFPGNVSLVCTLKGELGMKGGKRLGLSMS